MPNHITNILLVSPTVLNFLKGEKSLVDFEKVIPVPAYVHRGEIGWNKDGTLPLDPGCTISWYDWNRQNWGTKWNAYDCEEIDGGVQFDTAWSCPAPVINKLYELFPSERIELKYADEDIGSNFGHYLFENGVEIQLPIDDPIDFALTVKGYERDPECWFLNPKTGKWNYVEEEEE